MPDRKCMCCGNPYSVIDLCCPMCGFEQSELILDDKSVLASVEQYKTTDKYKELYKRNLFLPNLVNFRIDLYKYSWNGKSFEPQKECYQLVNKALECYKKASWTEPLIAHIVETNQKEIEIILFYNNILSGVEVDIPISIPIPEGGDDFWRIGISIDEDCVVTVYLGDKNHYGRRSLIDDSKHKKIQI